MGYPIIAPAPSATPQSVSITRLKAAFANAADGSVYANPPLSPPPVYANSTAVFLGEMIAANGNWYVCCVAGTTAATGTGPSAILGALIADGTASFSYYGAAVITTAAATAPTVSQASSDPAYGKYYGYNPFQALYGLWGCFPTVAANSASLGGYTYNSSASTQLTTGRRVEFFSDTAELVIDGHVSASNCFWRIAVDQFDGNGLRFIQPGGFSLASPYITLTFPIAKKRRFIIFFTKSSPDVFSGVECDSNANVWAPGGATVGQPSGSKNSLRAIIISDSLVAGDISAGPFLAGNDVPNRLALTLGIPDCWSFATAGTGEVVNTAPTYNFGQRVAQALTLNPDLWIIPGSVNDAAQTSASITAAVQATMQAIRAGGSTAPIIRMGAWPTSANANVLTCEAAILAGYNNFAATDQYAHGYVPIVSGVPPVITWTSNSTGSPAQYGLNNTRYLASDGHPIDWGTAHEADFYVEGIKKAIAGF